jgi:hypothetical protein
MLWQLIRDLKKGEHLDVYVGLAVAIVVLALHAVHAIYHVQLEPVIAPLTLLVLICLTTVLLNNRRKLEAIEHRITDSSPAGIQTRFPETQLEEAIAHGKDILQIGIHLHTNLTDYYEQYERALRVRCKIRILLLDPDGEAIKMAALRFAGDVQPSQERERLLSSLRRLRGLKERFPKQVDVRVIDYLLGYAGLLINGDASNGMLYVERYTLRTHAGSRKPKFVYSPADVEWFALYKHEMNELWSCGKPSSVVEESKTPTGGTDEGKNPG